MTLEEQFKEEKNIEAYEDNQMQPKVYSEIYVEWLEAKINYTRICEELKASFKKGDVVLVDGKEKRIVVQEFGNGSVELESKSGWLLIGKKRLELATKSL